MLSLGSLAVAPLIPVLVGDGWILWDEDRDGTCRRPRLFVVLVPSSTIGASFSLELSGARASVSRAISSLTDPWLSY